MAGNSDWEKYLRSVALDNDVNAAPDERMKQRMRQAIPLYDQARLTQKDKTVVAPSDNYLNAVGLNRDQIGAKSINLRDITPEQFGQMSRNIPRSTMINPYKLAGAARNANYGFPADVKQDQWYQYLMNRVNGGKTYEAQNGSPAFRAQDPLAQASYSLMRGEPIRSPINPGMEYLAQNRAAGAYYTPEYQQVLQDEATARWEQWNADREAWLDRMPQFVSQTKDTSQDQRQITRDYYAWAQEGRDKGYADDEFYVRNGMGDLVSDEWLNSYNDRLGAGITALEGKDWAGYEERHAQDLADLANGTAEARGDDDWRHLLARWDRADAEIVDGEQRDATRDEAELVAQIYNALYPDRGTITADDMFDEDGFNRAAYDQYTQEIASRDESVIPEGWKDYWGDEHQAALDQLDQLRIVQGAVQKEIGNREKYNGAMAMDDDMADAAQYAQYVSPYADNPNGIYGQRYSKDKPDSIYVFINEGKNAFIPDREDDYNPQADGLDLLTQNEIDTFNALYNNPDYGPDAAMEFLGGIQSALWARSRRATTEQSYLFEQKVGLAGGMLAADFTSIANALAAPINLIGAMTGNEYYTDPNSPAYSGNNVMQGIQSSGREFVQSKLGEDFGGFVYDTTFSTLQSATTMLLGRGLGGGSEKLAEWISLGLMGSSAAENALQANLDMGYSPVEACVRAVVEGGIEIATEKAQVERWLTGNVLRNQNGVLRSMLAEMLSEGGEELVGAVTNDVADQLLAVIPGTGKSKWQQEAEDLMLREGIDAKEAYTRVLANHAEDAAVSFASGAASGGLMTGGANIVKGGVNAASNLHMGRDMLRNNTVAAPAAQSLTEDFDGPGSVTPAQNMVQPADNWQNDQNVSEEATRADAQAAEVAGVQDEVTQGNRERGRSRLEQARANVADAQTRMEQAAQDMAAGNATEDDVNAAADALAEARMEERRAEAEARRDEVTEGNRQRGRERAAANRSQSETQAQTDEGKTEEAQDRGGVVDNNGGRSPVNVSTGLRSAMDLAMRLQGSDAATFAQQLQSDIDKGRKVGARKAGKLMKLLQESNINGVSEAARGINNQALSSRLTELGVNAHADQIAEVIQKAAENEGKLSGLTPAEKTLIQSSPQAQQVLEEFISDGSGKGKHGGQVQDWVKETRSKLQLNNVAGMLRAQTVRDVATGRKAQNGPRIETGNLTSTASVQRNVAGSIARTQNQHNDTQEQGSEQAPDQGGKSSRGVRVDGDYGNIVTIDAINGDGSVTMKVDVGGEQKVVNSDTVEGFGSDAIAAMVDYAGATGRMNAGALNTMINGWQNIDGVDLGDYMTTMADAYNAGYLGREMTATGNGVVDSLARSVFDQAKSQRSHEDAKRVQTARELGHIAQVGNLNIDNDVYDMLGADMDSQGNLVDRDGAPTGATREQLKSQVQLVAAMAQVIGSKWGTNVRLVAPQTIDGVQYITNNEGAREVWKGQGYYDANANELVLSVTAQEQNIHGAMVSNVITTMTHEITHALEKMGGQAYNDFRNEVLNLFGRNQAQLDRMIDAKMAQYRANNVAIDYQGALNEIVAESASMMLQNSKVVRDFYLRNATLAEKVRGIMSRFLEKVKSAFNGLSTRNSEASMLWDQQAGQYVGRLQELWDNAFLASTAARNADGSLTDEARRVSVTRTVSNEQLAANLGSMVGEDGRQFSLGADIGKLAMGVKVKFGDLVQAVNNAIFKSRLANMPGPVAEVFTDAADHVVADITGTGGVDLGDGAKMELRDDGLVAVHGLSVNNLVEQFTNWGGMPMPSIGVYGVKNMPNHRWFNGKGRAFVMFGQDIIDPAMNEKNALYEKDAFTPMVRYTDKENALPVRMDLVDRFMDVNKVYDDSSLRQALNGIAECIPRDMKLKDNPKEFRRRIAEALQSDDMRVPNGLYITKLGAVAKLYEAMNGNKNAIEHSGNEDFYTDKHDNPKSIAKIAKWVADTLYNPNTSGQSTAKTVFDQLKLQAPSVTGTPRVDLDTARANQTAENPVFQYAEAKPGYIIQHNMLRAVGLPTSMQGHAIVETMRNAGVHVEFFDDSVDGSAVDAIKNVAMTTPGAQFNLGSMQADMQTYRQMLAPLVQDGTMSMMEVDNLFGTIATAMDYIEQHTDILDFGAQFTRENRGFTPIKDNSDPLYKVSLDFSTLCKKRLLQQTIQDRLEARLAMERNARAGERTVLSPQERAAIRESLQNLRNQGLNIDVACGLCYVEAARLKAPAQMERFLKDPEFYIRKGILDRNGDLNKKRNTYRQTRIPELLADLESRMDTLSPADQAKVKEARQQLDEGKRPTKKMLPKAAQEQLYQEIRSMEVGLTDDELAEIAVVKELGQDAFTTSEGLTRLRHEHPIVWEAFSTYIRNATHSKGLEGDVPFYAGDTYARMGDQMIANMNKENGMRAQSWSDFQLYHILDYIGATIELATRGVKMQTYTKVPAFLELMGRTGAAINMSLIPKTDSATLDFDPVEGMDYDTSRKYRDLFHGNVGNILIGVSDAQIRSALANIGIDYIIPYHASGLSGEMQKRMGLKNWKSYQNWQSEKVPKGQKATSVSDWFDLQEAQRIQRQRQAEYDRGRESIRDRYFELTSQAEQAVAEGDDAKAMQLYDEARQTGYDVTWGARQAMQAMGDRYLALCRERGITPKFSTIRHSGSNEVTDLTREEGYWKLLIDRKMIDNITGEIIEQQAVKPNFDQSRLMRIMEDEVNRYTATEADRTAAIAEIDRMWESGEIQRMASSEHLKELVAKQEAAAVQISAVESAKDVQRSGRQLNLGSNVTSGMMDSDVQYSFGRGNAQGAYGQAVREAEYYARNGGMTDDEIISEIEDEYGVTLRRGYRGAWVSVIPNDGAQLIGSVFDRAYEEGRPVRVRDIYRHDALFEAYPQLGDYTVRVVDNGGKSTAIGDFNMRTKEITLYKDVIDGKGARDLVGHIIRHELQHSIQGIERSEQGSSPILWESIRNDLMKLSERVGTKVSDLLKAAGVDEWAIVDMTTEEEAAYLQNLLGEHFDTVTGADSMIYDTLKFLGQHTNMDLYEHTVGEIEAEAAAENAEPDYSRAVSVEEFRAKLPQLLRFNAALDSALVSMEGKTAENSRQMNLGNGNDSVQYNLGNDDPNKTHIKDQIRQHAAQIESVGVVADFDVSDNEFTSQYNSKMVAIEKLADRIGVLHRDDIGDISMQVKHIKKAFSYLKTRGEWAAMLAVPDVILDGAIIDGHDNHKYRNNGTITIAAQVRINGTLGNMAVVVKQTQINRFSVLRILDPNGGMFVINENNTDTTASRGTPETGLRAGQKVSVSDESISDYRQKVNSDNDRSYSLGNDQSSVRDFLMDLNPDTLRTQAEKEILRRYREASGKMQEIRGQMDEIQGRLNENAYESEIARKQDQNRMVVLRNQLERQNDIILEMEGNNGLGQMVRNVQNVLQHELAGLDTDGLDASIRELQAREADIQERLKADIKSLPKIDQLREIAKIYYKPALLDRMVSSMRRSGGMSTDEVRRSVYELAIAWAEMSANIDDGVKSAKAAERFNARVAALANNAVDNQVSSTALSELQDEIADSDVNLPLSLNDAEVAALKEHGVSVAEYARMIGMVGRVRVNHQARTTYAEDYWWSNNGDHNLSEDTVTPVSAIFGQLSYGDAAYGPWQVYEKFAAARAAEDSMMYPYGENVRDGEGYKTRGEAVAAATADIVNQLVSDGLPNFNAANISDAGKLAQMIAAVGAKFQSNLDTRKALEDRLAQSERAMETYATLRGGVTDSASGMVGYLMDYADRISQSYAETTLAEADTWRENDLEATYRANLERVKADYAQKLSLMQSKGAADVVRLQEQMAQDKANRKLHDRIRVLQGNIQRAGRRLDNAYRNESDKRKIPEQLKPMVARLLNTFLDKSGNLMFDVGGFLGGQKIADMQAAYDQLAQKISDLEMDASVLDADNAVVFGNLKVMLDRYNELFQGKGSRSTQALEGRIEILQQLSDLVTNVARAVTQANDEIVNGRRRNRVELAQDAANELKELPNHRYIKGQIGQMLSTLERLVLTNNATPYYFFKWLKNKAFQRAFDEQRTSENNWGLRMGEAQRDLEQIKRDVNFNAWEDQMDDKIKVRTASGTEVQMTKGQAMSLVATWIRERSAGILTETHHLDQGGFTLKGQKESTGRFTEEASTVSGKNRMDQATMDAVTAQLSPEMLDYVKRMTDYMSSTVADWGNEVTLRQLGIRKFGEKHYFPFQVASTNTSSGSEQGNLDPNGTGINQQSSVLKPGFGKRVLQKAWRGVAIDDFNTVCMNHIANMITYSTFSESVGSMQALLNQDVVLGEGDDAVTTKVKALFLQKYGLNKYNYLTRYLQDMNGGMRVEDEYANWQQKLLSTAKAAAVVGSGSVAMQQPLSYIRAASMIKPIYLAQALTKGHAEGFDNAFEEAKAYSGVAQIKDTGKFDIGFSAGNADWLNGHDSDLTKWMKFRDGALRLMGKEGFKGFRDQLNNIGGFLPGKMDAITWGRMWEAVKLEQAKAHPGMDVHSEEFLRDIVAPRFNDVMMATQVYDTTMTRSQLMRNKSTKAQMIGAFKAEPTLSACVLIDGIKNGPKAAATVAVLHLLNQVAQAAVKGLWSAGRKDDDEKTFAEKFLSGFFGNVVDEVNPVKLIPGAADAWDLFVNFFQGRDISDESLGASLINKASKAAEEAWNWYNGKPKYGSTWREVEETVGVIANLFGMPAKNLMRDTRAMYNWVMGNANRPDNNNVMRYTMMDAIPFRDSSRPAYYARAGKALLAGNMDEYEGIRDYMIIGGGMKEDGFGSKMKSWILDGVRSGDISQDDAIRICVEQGWYKDQKTAYSAITKVSSVAQHADDDGYEYNLYGRAVDAWLEGGADGMNGVITEMTGNGNEDGNVRKNITTQIGSRIKAGDMTADEGGKMYKALYPDKTDNDVYWQVEKWGSEAWLDDDDDTTWNKYDGIDSALESGDKAAVARERQLLIDHGVKETTVDGRIYSAGANAVHNAIQDGTTADVTRAVKQLIADGNKPSKVQSSITSKWADEYRAHPTPALKNKIVQAYLATGMSNAKATQKVDDWLK